MNTKEISNALIETLKNNELQDLTSDISEIVLDKFINQGLLQQIPIIKSLTNITKGFSQIKDQLFLKKVIAFLSESKKIKAAERRVVIDKIDNSKKYRLKIGEKLLYLIDKSDDWEKSELISVFFNALIKNKITYEEFIKISKITEKLTIYDLQKFQKIVKKNKENYLTINNFGEDDNEISDLINSGLFIYYNNEVNVEDEDDWKMERKYKTTGGELIIQISHLGKKINTLLN